MKAAVVSQAAAQFEIKDVEIADPIGHEVLIDVKASGLCHSDLHLSSTLDYGYDFPMILGHESSGIVSAVGPDVTDFQVGDHVAGSLIASCGQCRNCRSGRSHICLNEETLQRPPEVAPRITVDGQPVNQMYGIGGFAPQSLVHENQLARIPAEIPFPQAAILGCGVMTGVGSVINSARVRPGSTVAVLGLGGVGLNAINGARLAGAKTIIGVDVQPEKEHLAKKFGATHFVNSSADPVAEVHELTEGGADYVFEVVGANVTQRLAVQLGGVESEIYFVGIAQPNEELPINTLQEFIRGQKRLIGVHMGSSDVKRDIPLYAELYLSGRLNLDDLIYQEISLDDINDAATELKRGQLARSVITTF